MQLNKTNNSLIVIVGPTAVGKTDLSIQLAQRFNGEIISADSRLFYRGMDIGTAKPSLEERMGVPHHLIDVSEPDQVWSLSLFQTKIKEIIKDIHARGKMPFLVGGSGQYIQAVIEGWELPPQSPEIKIRNVLEDWGKEIGALALYEKLKIIDPQAAGHIEYQNKRRTIRALEVIFMTGKKFSEQRRRGNCPYSLLMIGLKRNRPELYARIDQRIEAMITNGLVEETNLLLEKGYSSHLPTLSAIGYREIIDYIQGKITLDEAIVLMKRNTREFVRRQANWFKETDPKIHWFEMREGVLEDIESLIHSGEGWIAPG